MERVLEPEVMDTWEEAQEYDSMDFAAVNTAFAEQAISLGPSAGQILDLGTGTARIPILMAQKRPQWQILGIDLSINMLKLGQENIRQAGLETQITLETADVKTLPYPEKQFDMVVSNSLIHHLPDPLPFLQELKRVLRPQGAIFLRDLFRPADLETIEQIVATIGPEYSPHQRQLFYDSLQAAFTLEEVQDLLQAAGLADLHIYQSSDRHWTAARAFNVTSRDTQSSR